MEDDVTGQYVELGEGWREELECLFSTISPRFGRIERQRHAWEYLLWLLSSVERNHGWQLAEAVEHTTPYSLQHLLDRAPWDANAATSVLAIPALIGGWLYGWSWLDPVMGIAGAILVAVWAKGLIVDTGKVLLDREMDHPVVNDIRDVVEGGDEMDDTRITDLHVWRVGKKVYSCALTVVTHDATLTATDIRARLAVHEEIVHSTIEMHRCPDREVSKFPD